MENKKEQAPVKLIFAAAGLWLGLAIAFNGLGAYVAKGYSYGYGYGYGYGYSFSGGDVEVSFDDEDVHSKKTSKDEVSLCFEKTSKIKYYLISKNRRFDGAKWKRLDKDKCVKLKVNTDFNNKRTKFFIKFKDASEAVSKVMTKTVIYQKPERAAIRVSRKNFTAGEVMILRGRRFSKNDQAAIYFSNRNGVYGYPQKIGTDQFGNLKFEHNVGQLKGIFSWYAVDLKTGKRSRNVNYNVN